MNGADPLEGAEETAEAVLEAAATAGFELSRDQLVRWHRHGLIFRPRQRSRGPGGGSGKETVYPAGTTSLVVQICEVRDRSGEHRLDELGWLCWWQELPVPDRLAREYLTAQLAELRTTADKLLTPDGELTDFADDALDSARRVRIEQLPMSWTRRRIGANDFDLFLQSLLMVFAGRTGDLTDEAIAQMEHGLGLDRARTDTLANTAGPWLDSDARADFEHIGERASLDSMEKALTSCSDADLIQARAHVQAFVPVISQMGSVFRQTGDRWSYGYAAFGPIFEYMLSSPEGQAQFVLYMLSNVAADGTEGLDVIIDQRGGAKRNSGMLEALKAMRAEVPEVAKAVPLRMFGKAMASVEAQEKLFARIADLRETCGDQMDAFFARHPEYRPAPEA